MNTITATSARSNFFKLIKQSIDSHLPFRISSKSGNAILISEEEYESLIETTELLSIPGFKESIEKADQEIKNGDTVSFEEFCLK